MVGRSSGSLSDHLIRNLSLGEVRDGVHFQSGLYLGHEKDTSLRGGHLRGGLHEELNNPVFQDEGRLVDLVSQYGIYFGRDSEIVAAAPVEGEKIVKKLVPVREYPVGPEDLFLFRPETA